tara:strand:+ start:623 stop:850 length:228 start_codon:yes stop_codon:yes gene_type:complete
VEQLFFKSFNFRMIGEIIYFFLTILFGGGFAYLLLVAWGSWFTEGNFEEKSRTKTYLTIIVVGILIYLWLNLLNV